MPFYTSDPLSTLLGHKNNIPSIFQEHVLKISIPSAGTAQPVGTEEEGIKRLVVTILPHINTKCLQNIPLITTTKKKKKYKNNTMKIETEIKLAVEEYLVKNLIVKIDVFLKSAYREIKKNTSFFA